MSYGYSSEPQFGPQSFPQQPRSSGFNWLIGLLLMGLGVVILGGVLFVAGLWYVVKNVDGWIVGLGREAIVAMVNDSEIPPQEKKEVIEQIDRAVNAYKEGKIDQADLERVLTELQESPALVVISLYGMDELYFAGAELPEAEIAQGRRSYQRVLRGVYEGKIDEEAFYNALPGPGIQPVRFDGGGDFEQLQKELTVLGGAADDMAADDLRESLIKLKVMADNAGIPDEPFELDIGDEVKKIVDRLLDGK
jgi:hypothetical protein